MKPEHFRAASVRANSYDDETGTIQVIWTTGASVRRVDWDGEEYDEVLSLEPGAVNLDRLNGGAPLLDAHQDRESANIVGSVVQGTAKIENGRGVATVLLSKASDVADIVTKIREGTARNVSVGYWIDHTVRRDGNPPTIFVDRWTPLEISVAPIPADAGAQFRSVISRRTKRRSRTETAAAYARRLLQPVHSPAEQRGAAEARKARSRKAGNAEQRGAREARKLLRQA